MSNARVLVLASYGNEIIRKFCNKAMLVKNGNQIAFGDVDEIIERHINES